jgi:hypothetical protein
MVWRFSTSAGRADEGEVRARFLDRVNEEVVDDENEDVGWALALALAFDGEAEEKDDVGFSRRWK